MAQYIAEALRSAIHDGTLADGHELNQVHLAEHFGTSRVPVREALRMLQAEGLISAPAHRCAQVTGSTRERVMELFELRALLEGHLLQKSGPSFDERSVAHLRRLCAAMDDTDDHEVWLAKNQEFHEALCAPAKADMTQQLARQLARRYLQAPRAEHPVLKEVSGKEHRGIVDAIERGDILEARALLEQHIGHTRKTVLERIDARAASALTD